MKKLIAVAVVFALVAGGLFAADFGAEVFTGVKVMQGDNDKILNAKGKEANAPMTVSGGHYRLRAEASGGNDTFGGWLRIENGNFQGTNWWKPIDQIKMTIGANSDGVFGKDNGAAGWGFYAMPSEIGIVNPSNVWGGGYFHQKGGVMRNAFFGGYGIDGMALEVIPADQFNLVVGLPFFNGGQYKDLFQAIMVQGNINLDFGQIAITYKGDHGVGTNNKDGDADFKTTGKFYVNAEISSIDSLGLNVGIGAAIPGDKYNAAGDKGSVYDNIYIGIAAQYDVSDAFGLKARLLTSFGGGEKDKDSKEVAREPFHIGMDLLPYITISDEMKLFIGVGMSFKAADQAMTKPGEFEDVEDSAVFGWHFNPYLRVGAEWGPTFYVGLRVWSNGEVTATTFDKGTKVPNDWKDWTRVQFEVPLGLIVSF